MSKRSLKNLGPIRTRASWERVKYSGLGPLHSVHKMDLILRSMERIRKCNSLWPLNLIYMIICVIVLGLVGFDKFVFSNLVCVL